MTDVSGGEGWVASLALESGPGQTACLRYEETTDGGRTRAPGAVRVPRSRRDHHLQPALAAECVQRRHDAGSTRGDGPVRSRPRGGRRGTDRCGTGVFLRCRRAAAAVAAPGGDGEAWRATGAGCEFRKTADRLCELEAGDLRRARLRARPGARHRAGM